MLLIIVMRSLKTSSLLRWENAIHVSCVLFSIRTTSLVLAANNLVFGLWMTRSWLIRTWGWKAKSGRLLSSPADLALERTTYMMPGFLDSNAFVTGLMTIYLLMFPCPIVMPWTLWMVVPKLVEGEFGFWSSSCSWVFFPLERQAPRWDVP